MERDLELQAIDDELVQATAEAFRLGRRARLDRAEKDGHRSSLLKRLQHPEQRDVPVAPAKVNLR